MRIYKGNSIVWGALFYAGSGLALAAPAQESEPTSVTSAGPVVSTELVKELLHWIGAHSDYDIAVFLDKPPEIAFCECGDTISYEGETLVVHTPIKGLYDKKAYKIILVEPWHASDLKNVSTLLHELIHFVQYQSKTWPCWQKTEWEAYKLQAAWQQEQSLDVNFNWIQIFFKASCEKPREIHPSRH